ncbi:MAG: flagellar hook-length control protein FliK [Nitrospirae bacterium]|nr:MAG: flagellar hook-length control protein FliK [Nitrospirota bacterium]
MNAGLLISVSTGNDGVKASGQAVADVPKSEGHSGETSFGKVLTQAGEHVDAVTDSADAASPKADPPASMASLSPLQMALALQASALVAVQAGQGGQAAVDGQSDSAQPGASSPGETLSLQSLQLSQAGQATSALVPPSGSDQMPTVAAGTALTMAGQVGMAAMTEPAGQASPTNVNQPTLTNQAATMTQALLQNVGSQTQPNDASNRQAEVPQQQNVAEAVAKEPQVQLELVNKIGPAEASHLSVGGPIAAEPERIPSQPEPSAPAPQLNGTGQEKDPGPIAAGAGQPIQAPSELDATPDAAAPSSQTGLQNRAMTEQARQLAASMQTDKSKEPGKGQKEPQSPQLVTGAERLGVGTGDGRTGHIDGAAKVVVPTPVAALPAEPAAVPSVQSLRLEVERPDLGGVQVRVVLADQTVHAKVTTGQVEVRDFLVARQDQLAVGLKASGLEMGEFQVDVDPQGRGQSGPGWFAGAQGDQADQGRRQPGPQATQPLPMEPRVEQWSGYGHGALSGVLERRTLNVFA